ncbi:LPS export ABC transporter permease LptF [Granulicella cerasi]|uniref:LPS export ABC transporter permease LptF n=1 Tax=Granulicella cerasi TaxID=741063 RepID=A0ABW1ZGL1_9BACT
MRIFTRYILREVIGYAALGGVLFTFILFMRYLLPLLELAVRGVAGPGDILLLIGYLLPNFLTLTIPMAVLIGILLGLSRLAADSEITAMRASGLGVMSFIRIVGLLAVVMWGLGLANSLWLAPRAARALLQYEEQAKTSQATVEVQARVFYEDFKNYVLYVQEVQPGANGTALWKHVFLADLTKPSQPRIISAERTYVLSSDAQTLHLQMEDGSRHDLSRDDPNRYDISTFNTADLPVQVGQQGEDSHLSRRDTPLQATPTSELWTLMHRPGDSRSYRIELHRRFSFPAACLVLMLVGVPLGLSSKRGGKGTGFVVTLLLVFLYYFASSMGIAMARQGKVSAGVGVWGANVLFALAGGVLIQQMSRSALSLGLLSQLGSTIAGIFSKKQKTPASELRTNTLSNQWTQRLRRALHVRFPSSSTSM